MAPPKFTDADLRACLDAGHTQAEAARHFGVSEAAIHQRLKRLKQLTSRVVRSGEGRPGRGGQLNATARLERIQQVIDEELAWAVTEARREGANRGSVVDVVLRLSGEVRHQLALQLEISRTLVDLRVVKEFQETVLDIIRQESPETGRRIVARLKERRALRPSAQLPALSGGSDALMA